MSNPVRAAKKIGKDDNWFIKRQLHEEKYIAGPHHAHELEGIAGDLYRFILGIPRKLPDPSRGPALETETALPNSQMACCDFQAG